MRIIYNKHFPFSPFWATNIFGIIFCREDKGRLSEVDKNHEYIHTLQQKELLYIGFLLWYSIEWLVRFIRCRRFMKAYYDLYFEREAYRMERDLEYSKHRRHYAWLPMFAKEEGLLREFYDFCCEIVSFIQEDFRLWKYLFFLLSAVGIIIAQVQYDIYGLLLAPSYADGTSMLRLPLFYCTVYYTALILTLLLHGETHRLRQWQVWVLPAFLVAVDGAGQGFDAYRHWIDDAADLYHKDRYYLKLVGAFFFRSVGIVAMLCVFHWLTDRHFGLYGLVRSRRYLRIYGMIYLILVPVFVVVSFTPQFVEYYPKMDIAYCTQVFGWEDWRTIGLFELCYANDFLAVESMFRGAMVIGLSRWLGPRAVIPMALTYMSIHLGKPDLELCSSVIGGYILGILAFRTRHLWGGIVIHLGIAMLFELLGLLRYYV